jgi:hypothetical protein
MSNLLNLKSKHSLLGESNPISDADIQTGGGAGTHFANWRNSAFPLQGSPEPDHTDINDPIFDNSPLETLLYKDYTYNSGGGDPSYDVTIPYAPSRGLHADLWDGDPPEASYNAYGRYIEDGIGPSDGFYTTE